MEKEHNHHGNTFFSGFILGFIVGAAVVFFLGTAKGRRMLQALSEEGFNGASELRELLEIPQEEDEEYYGDEAEEEMEEEQVDVARPQAVMHHPVSKVKRFFKGAHKKPLS